MAFAKDQWGRRGQDEARRESCPGGQPLSDSRPQLRSARKPQRERPRPGDSESHVISFFPPGSRGESAGREGRGQGQLEQPPAGAVRSRSSLNCLPDGSTPTRSLAIGWDGGARPGRGRCKSALPS